MDHDPRRASPQTSAPERVRRIVFISHANPEDNPAAVWFATQLTLLGYEVWCDLNNIHAGESEFWLKVQKIIANQTAKFVYILSNASCDFDKKKGIYKELQAADNLRIDNFVLPVRIEKLTHPLPILLGTSLYINGENWASGLLDLVERLCEDGVPRQKGIDFEKISSWWPAITAEKLIVKFEEDELVSNILPIQAMPQNIHFTRVLANGNPITGFNSLRKVLPTNPAFYAHGNYAVSFANSSDYASLVKDLDFESAHVLETQAFLSSGHQETRLNADIAQNIVTYLVGKAWDAFMASKELSSKGMGRNGRATWYVRDGLIPNNKTSLAEAGKRKVSIQLVGSLQHYRKTYTWHAGLFAAVDLRTHNGIVLTPKAVITHRYNTSSGRMPIPIDDKRIQKKLNWWNKQWRQKLLAMLSWLSEAQPKIAILIGSQQLLLSGMPQAYFSNTSCNDISDDDVINQAMEVIIEHAHSS